ncbi:MAG: putative zinc-binding protein, partial [Verrucomicrobia bacterium]|nr:putative zinc-binding protein [Verrucomicrobiota bacterium]
AAARQLQSQWHMKMSCIAGVGGRVKIILDVVQSAPQLLVIDGCPLECSAHSLRHAGITRFHHLKLHDLGIRKQSCEADAATLATVTEAALKMLSAENQSVIANT